jgi:hypothetical protein
MATQTPKPKPDLTRRLTKAYASAAREFVPA